ncbi:hypothetical protein [Helicobacter sp. 23-1045]
MILSASQNPFPNKIKGKIVAKKWFFEARFCDFVIARFCVSQNRGNLNLIKLYNTKLNFYAIISLTFYKNMEFYFGKKFIHNARRGTKRFTR